MAGEGCKSNGVRALSKQVRPWHDWNKRNNGERTSEVENYFVDGTQHFNKIDR
ncbi:MAG: hypothetical protein M1587_00100 [Thaumarchaeota archaeon]|nr:hypothetical protein [Nitrososphaerota archaeon]